MPDKVSELAGIVTDAMKSTVEKKTEEYDTIATVTRIDEDGTTWVSIPGGVVETPIRQSISVSPGDEVQVHVGGGRAWTQGNYTSPPTDDTRANRAYGVASKARDSAIIAKTTAENAEGEAVRAKQAADSAERSAEDAYDYAQQAMGSARQAEKSANTALEKAELATDYANEANDHAQTALAYSNSAFTFAQTAEQNATDALKYANSANSSATGALNSLGEVEKVIDALNWISEHGEYSDQPTEDTTVRNGKWYFERTGTSPNYVYSVVDAQPSDNPHEEGWYELVSVDSAISNYVMSHIALTDDGLSLQTDGTPTRLLLSPEDGLVIKGLGGQTLATYGQDAIIGDIYSFHIKIDGTELGFYNAAQKIAYINGNKLYITQSVVLQQMDIGERTADGGDGQWSWKVHKINNKNNLYLKWNG